MKRKVVLAFLLTGALVLSGCSKTNNSNETSSGSTSTDSSAQGIDVSNMFSDRDKEIGYDEENSTVIKLSDDSTTCDSDAVQISGNTVTIIGEGTYILSGTLTDGMVIVDAEDTDKVQLVLDGVDITSAESAAIYVREADKVFITTASDSKIHSRMEVPTLQLTTTISTLRFFKIRSDVKRRRFSDNYSKGGTRCRVKG